LVFILNWKLGLFVAFIAAFNLAGRRLPERTQTWMRLLNNGFIALGVSVVLVSHWSPLGPEKGWIRNFIFVVLILGAILSFFRVFQHFYDRILKWCLNNKVAFLSIPFVILLMGSTIWRGVDNLLGWIPNVIKNSAPITYLAR
jgi:Cu(I)/Ag(I) efflux system membrane protein CusA/SilA